MNRTIDEVAREMTALKPPDLRRAVIARITGAEVRRSPFGARRWVRVPLAAAIACAAAVFVSRDPVRVPPATADAPTVAVAPPPAATTAIPVRKELASSIIAAAARLAEARGRSPRAKVYEADRPTEQVESIAIAPLAVDALRPDPIQIERLDTPTSMTVAPLDVTDPQKERDR